MGIAGESARKCSPTPRTESAAAHEVLGRQGLGLAHAGATSAHVDAGRPAGGAEERGHAALYGIVGRMPDQ